MHIPKSLRIFVSTIKTNTIMDSVEITKGIFFITRFMGKEFKLPNSHNKSLSECIELLSWDSLIPVVERILTYMVVDETYYQLKEAVWSFDKKEVFEVCVKCIEEFELNKLKK